ncbi:transposase [Spirosoma sp. BT702]|uniref:Transposase n=2 Tax=Spirosoma profusum TaxID=2771354 RepID=A0A926XZ90_9BACT|nr:transposase [Spirosoma profusum]
MVTVGTVLRPSDGRAAVDVTWSNGQTEERVTRLKLIKQQMYG